MSDLETAGKDQQIRSSQTAPLPDAAAGKDRPQIPPLSSSQTAAPVPTEVPPTPGNASVLIGGRRRKRTAKKSSKRKVSRKSAKKQRKGKASKKGSRRK